MEYGQRLREKRRAQNLTQEQLAQRITARGHQVTSGNVSNIERGYDRRLDGSAVQPNKNFVILAAEILGDDVDEALKAADYAPLSDTDFGNDPEGFYRGLEKLPKHMRPVATASIRAIIESLASQDLHDTNYIDDTEERDADENGTRES